MSFLSCLFYCQFDCHPIRIRQHLVFTTYFAWPVLTLPFQCTQDLRMDSRSGSLGFYLHFVLLFQIKLHFDICFIEPSRHFPVSRHLALQDLKLSRFLSWYMYDMVQVPIKFRLAYVSPWDLNPCPFLFNFRISSCLSRVQLGLDCLISRTKSVIVG